MVIYLYCTFCILVFLQYLAFISSIFLCILQISSFLHYFAFHKLYSHIMAVGISA